MNENTAALPPLPAADLALLKDHIASQGLPAQVAAITSDAPLTVVSAGAGTGKTWTLAWRFVWTALTRTDVRSILTLTFTEKAAAEMRSRIAALLAELAPVLSASEELSRRRAAALEALDQAYISTLHGFGARVIAEAGLSLPVEPSLRLISAPEADEFWAELSGALDRLDADWFCSHLTEETEKNAVAALLDSGDTAQTINAFGAGAIANFAREFESLMADEGRSPETTLADSAAAAEKARALLGRIVDRECARLADLWQDALDVDPAEYGKGQLVQRVTALRGKWRARGFESAVDVREFVADAAEAVYRASGKLKDALAAAMGMKVSDWRTQAKNIEPFARLVGEGFSENELRLRDVLVRLACLCWRAWNAYRDARGGLTFGDMIALAARALRASPEYAARFSEVLVDEFQDTNGTQDELLTVIREAARARLFVVGDLKQSIYRFRHAEPALFEKYIREAQNGGGEYIRLSVSFRSGERVLAAVNERFGGIWARALGEGLNVPYEPLESPRGLKRASGWIDERQGTTLPVCERLIEDYQRDDEGRSDEKAPAGRDRLAARLARRLSQLTKDGALVWDGKHLRAVNWG
ncbi:MAG: UvrD-helicase domain-containing protein, partial [Pyramidobacter sp.]|nr:UvrD-helicase domain-containing protein [Pyramidobacter sp.]